ncbi:MAG TPA: BON domain-containing protein [Nitrospiria bacterium]|nr:BON domain-containing protein [Nitrospiria bacterium]
MADKETVIKMVRAALEHERRINLHRYPIGMDYSDGDLTLDGEVENIAAKKLAMELAIAVPGVDAIIDRLRIEPAKKMGDGEILDAVREALFREPALQNCAIRVKSKERIETVREALLKPSGAIEISVKDGVVLLDDRVTNLVQKRLAGVLAWWIPGSRDVVNGMEVDPPEEDRDDLLTDAVRIVLEKDPLVRADQIRASARNLVVTLEGLVRSEPEKQMAENDAWFVFGVDRVVNNLKVQK